MKFMRYSFIVIILLLICTSCSKKTVVNTPDNPTPTENNKGNAAVIKVEVSGSPNSYLFSVTIKSPDTGCDQYADWWEVITSDEQLKHRRIIFYGKAYKSIVVHPRKPRTSNHHCLS